MESKKSWKTITEIGKKIKKNWLKISKSHGVDLNIQGMMLTKL